MIRIDKIHIKEFRGIRELTLELKGQNFAACGPNGTGKSGIVDAIEFALTGNISRLAGAGTGGLSVKAHGPHVDSRNKPNAASVTLDVTIPSLGNKKTQIRRTVKSVSAPEIKPADNDGIAAFESVNLHPEFVLSRRELIRYVLSEPGLEGGPITPASRRHRETAGRASEDRQRLYQGSPRAGARGKGRHHQPSHRARHRATHQEIRSRCRQSAP